MADLITMLSAAAGGKVRDPDFNSTVLLLHGDGTNGAQNNTFLDSSTNNFTITRNGNTTQGTFSPFSRSSGNLVNAPYNSAVHGGSAYFDGSGDYLTAAASADFDLGGGDFTVEGWFYVLSTTANPHFFQFSTSGTNRWNVYRDTNFYIFSAISGVNTTSDTGDAVPLNQWFHLAVVKSSTTTKIYLDGVEIYSDGRSYPTGNMLLSIGFQDRGGLSADYLTGWVSSFRVVKGTAVYTAAFTPPTAPLTAIANTELLLNFTNAGIIDNTGKNNLETVGNAQIDTTTKKYGTGSMEFDGTGDWLLMPNTPDQQLGTGNFTIEFWVYLATGDTGSARGLVAKGTSTTGFLVSLDSSQKVVFTYTTSTITSSGAITLDAWNHIAVVREGTGSNQTKIYIGGTNDGTGTVSTDFNQTSVMYVGANRTGGDPMKGYIDDLRITKGVARYTAAFTPPTKAFPDQ